jgi:hypothetical protein
MNAQFKEIAKEAFIIAYKENFGNITISCEASGLQTRREQLKSVDKSSSGLKSGYCILSFQIKD